MEKYKLIPIGKMADINGITIPTLRLYDKLGLLKPRYVDENSGYRYYDITQNARLDLIAYMKELGMSLTEVADVFEKEDLELIEDILSRKNEQLHEQMREIKSRHNAVERAIISIERYRKSPVTGTISLEYIDKRYIWGIPCPSNFYEQGIESYEHALTQLHGALVANGVRHIHSYNSGTSIARQNYLDGNFVPESVFVFCEKDMPELSQTTALESGMYACIYLDNFDDEILYAGRLSEFCRRNNYTVCGDYICEVLTEFNVFAEEKRNMFLRLQVPVAFQKKLDSNVR